MSRPISRGAPLVVWAPSGWRASPKTPSAPAKAASSAPYESCTPAFVPGAKARTGEARSRNVMALLLVKRSRESGASSWPTVTPTPDGRRCSNQSAFRYGSSLAEPRLEAVMDRPAERDVAFGVEEGAPDADVGSDAVDVPGRRERGGVHVQAAAGASADEGITREEAPGWWQRGVVRPAKLVA